jgi:hypothetical protein
MPTYPFIITQTGNYCLLAPNAMQGETGVVIQLTGSGSWTAALRRNTAAGVEPPVFAVKSYVDRSTGYEVTDGSVFGETNSPVTIETTSRGMELWLLVTINSGTGITVMCSPAAGTAKRPAGASVFDLNFDAVPAAVVETDLELAIESAVATQNGT